MQFIFFIHSQHMNVATDGYLFQNYFPELSNIPHTDHIPQIQGN